jgi:SAM-dependent methyltransferase
MSTATKYGPPAERGSEAQYADPARYLGHRAELVVALGPRLERGDTVVDLACGDGGLAEPLLERGRLNYLGVDLCEQMVAAARRRLGGRATVEHGDLNTFHVSQSVEAVTCFRAVYYASDRPSFFRHVASYSAKKLVFDINPRQFRVPDIVRDLRGAGFDRVLLRPFFAPQSRALPGTVAAALVALERSGPLARLVLRRHFTYLCVASRVGTAMSSASQRLG